jgi:eukaryotic translation initiation factor 2-alpha kinase 4
MQQPPLSARHTINNFMRKK